MGVAVGFYRHGAAHRGRSAGVGLGHAIGGQCGGGTDGSAVRASEREWRRDEPRRAFRARRLRRLRGARRNVTRSWARGCDDDMSVGFVLGWEVSTSTELSWDGGVVGVGELGNGAAAVGWMSLICCRGSISCARSHSMVYGDRKERGREHGQWPCWLFAARRRVGSRNAISPSCSSSYNPNVSCLRV